MEENKPTANPIVSPLVSITTLHDNLVKDGYELPDVGKFFKSLKDDKVRQTLHENLIKDGYELSDFNTFSSDLGYPQKKKIISPVSQSLDTNSQSKKFEDIPDLGKAPNLSAQQDQIQPIRNTAPTLDEIKRSIGGRIAMTKTQGQKVKIGQNEYDKPAGEPVKLSEYLQYKGISPTDILSHDTQDRDITSTDLNLFDQQLQNIKYKYTSPNVKSEDLQIQDTDSPYVKQAKLIGLQAKTNRDASTGEKYVQGTIKGITQGIDDMVVKPVTGLVKLVEDIHGLSTPLGIMKNAAGLPQDHPLTEDVPNFFKKHFKGYNDQGQRMAGTPDLPNTTGGAIVGGFASLPGMLLSLAATPEAKVAGIGLKMATNMGLISFGNAYNILSDENIPITDRLEKASKEGLKGAKQGLLMEGIMYTGAGNPLKSIAVNAVGFGGLNVVDQFNQTGDVDWHSALGNAIFGGTLGVMGGGEYEQILPKRINDALANYFGTPSDALKTSAYMDLDVNKVREIADKLVGKVIPNDKVDVTDNGDGTQSVKINVDPNSLTKQDVNDLTQGQTLHNLADAAALDKHFSDPKVAEKAISDIQNSDLPDDQKQLQINRIKESVSNNDPINQKSELPAIEVESLEKQKENIQNEPVSQPIKDAKTKAIDDQIKIKKDEIAQIVNPTKIETPAKDTNVPTKTEKVGGKKSVVPKEPESQPESTKEPITETEPAAALDQATKQGKKIYSDFDDTLYDHKTKVLTPLGEDIKARIAKGEDISIATHRKDTPESRKQIADMLGIDPAKIHMDLSPEGKAEISKDGVLIDNDPANIKAKKDSGGEAIEVKPVGDNTTPTETDKSKPDAKKSDVFEVPLPKIKTDTKRFQNRSELDKEQVKNIAENWDKNQFDSIVVWKDKNGQTFLLAGHHRLEAAKLRNEKSIPSRYFKGTEAEAVKYAKELSNANRRMETPVERASIYSKMRQEGKKRSEIQEALKIEGKNKTLIENISHLNPNGKIISMLKSFTKAGDTKTIRITEQVADWIGAVRKFYPELSDAHEDELYDWLINKNAIDKIKTKVDLQMRLGRVIDNVRLGPDEPLNLENKITKGQLQTDKENEIANVKANIKELEKERDKGKPSTERLKEITHGIEKQNKVLGELNKQLKEAIEGDKAQGSLFDQMFNDINENVKNGNITDEAASEFIGSRENLESDEPIIKDIESKANNDNKAELDQAVKESENLLKSQEDATETGKVKEDSQQQHKGSYAQLPQEGNDRNVNPEVKSKGAENGNSDSVLKSEKEVTNKIGQIAKLLKSRDKKINQKELEKQILKKYNDYVKTLGEEKAKQGLDSELKRANGDNSGILQSSISFGLEKYMISFAEKDVAPRMIKAVNFLKNAFKVGDRILRPVSQGFNSRATARIMRYKLAELAHKTELAYEHFKVIGDHFDRLSNDYKLKLIDYAENKTEYIKQGIPRFGLEGEIEAMDLMQDLLGEKYDYILKTYLKKKGDHIKFIENYFPHFWKKPESVESFISKLMGGKNLKGEEGFLKKRTLPDTKYGIDHGFEPLTTNPVELYLLKNREMDRFIMGSDIFNSLKTSKLVKYVPLLGGKVPEGYTKIDDKIGKVMQFSEKEKGLIHRGNYYMPDDAALIINNYLSMGMAGTPLKGVYEIMRESGNMLNQAQLGLSAFHAGFTTMDVMVSKAALGIMKVSQGNILSGLKDIATFPVSPYTNFMEGYAFREAYKGHGIISPELQKLIQDFEIAGGRANMDAIYTNNAVDNFYKALRNTGKSGVSNPIGAAIRVPGAILEKVSRPIMAHLVPIQKLGVFIDMAKNVNHEAKRKGWTEDKRQDRLQEAWDSVDNRMGQLVYDNLFWNKTLKDLSMVMVRSVGWNFGSIRELGGGLKDIGIMTKNIGSNLLNKAKGIPERTEVRMTPRMAYTITMPFVVGLAGAITSYLYTGKSPDDLQGYYYIKTGFKNEDGTDERVSLASYMKDVYAYSSEPVKTVKNKFHPLLGAITNMILNKDFFGYNITDESVWTPSLKHLTDELEYMAQQFIPFGVSNAIQRGKAGEPLGRQIQSFVGITPAPKYITNTKAQTEIGELYSSRFGGATKPRAQKEIDDWKKQIVSLLKKKNVAETDEEKDSLQGQAETALQEGIEKGYVKQNSKDKQLQSLTKRVTGAFDEFAFKRFSKYDKAKLLLKFDDEALKKYYPLAGKILEDMSPEKADELRVKLKKVGIQPEPETVGNDFN